MLIFSRWDWFACDACAERGLRMPCGESCVESRMRENRTYGSERGSELPYLGAHPYLYGTERERSSRNTKASWCNRDPAVVRLGRDSRAADREAFLDGRGYVTPAPDSRGILPPAHVLQSPCPVAGNMPGELGSGVTYSGPSTITVPNGALATHEASGESWTSPSCRRHRCDPLSQAPGQSIPCPGRRRRLGDFPP